MASGVHLSRLGNSCHVGKLVKELPIVRLERMLGFHFGFFPLFFFQDAFEMSGSSVSQHPCSLGTETQQDSFKRCFPSHLLGWGLSPPKQR